MPPPRSLPSLVFLSKIRDIEQSPFTKFSSDSTVIFYLFIPEFVSQTKEGQHDCHGANFSEVQSILTGDQDPIVHKNKIKHCYNINQLSLG